MASVEKNQKKQAEFGVLEDVVIMYAKIDRPQLDRDKKDLEFSVQVVTDNEDVADAFSERFGKVNVKKIKVVDYEEKFKTPCPFKGVKSVWSWPLKRSATKDGKDFQPENWPRVYLDKNDGTTVDITAKKISNGVKGTVSYYIFPSKQGDHPYLSSVVIKEDDFVEYVSEPTEGAGGAGNAADPLRKKSVVKDDEADKARLEAVRKASAEKPASNAAKPDDEEDEQDDDEEVESPF